MSFETPEQDVPRDRWGRPLIVPASGGKPVAYTRTTTLAKLGDTTQLTKWKQRMVLLGAVAKPDILLFARGVVDPHSRDGKKAMDNIAEQAMEAADANRRRELGTAMHGLCQQMDRGDDMSGVPDVYKADLRAYWEATRGLRVVEMETFGVLDELQVAGRWDRVVEVGGRRYVADIKTGEHVEYGALDIAIQLACYSRMTPYSTVTGERTPRTPDTQPDLDRAIVIHLPVESGRCDLKWIDIRTGWEAAKVAAEVRRLRSMRDLMSEFSLDVAELIANASTVEELRSLWSPDWAPELVELAKARAALLAAGAA